MHTTTTATVMPRPTAGEFVVFEALLLLGLVLLLIL